MALATPLDPPPQHGATILLTFSQNRIQKPKRRLAARRRLGPSKQLVKVTLFVQVPIQNTNNSDFNTNTIVFTMIAFAFAMS